MPYRFSIAALLLATTVLGIVLAWGFVDEGPPCLAQTGRDLDVVIIGKGYFQVIDSEGEVFYTREGRFEINENGAIALASNGYLLEPPINVPGEAFNVTMQPDGNAQTLCQDISEPISIGCLAVTKFADEQSMLTPAGSGLWKTTFFHRGIQTEPGDQSGTYLLQGWLEQRQDNRSHWWGVFLGAVVGSILTLLILQAAKSNVE